MLKILLIICIVIFPITRLIAIETKDLREEKKSQVFPECSDIKSGVCWKGGPRDYTQNERKEWHKQIKDIICKGKYHKNLPNCSEIIWNEQGVICLKGTRDIDIEHQSKEYSKNMRQILEDLTEYPKTDNGCLNKSSIEQKWPPDGPSLSIE